MICPYCNGLSSLEVACPACSNSMHNNGTVQEVLGPYSPYEENSKLQEQRQCVHLLYCRYCHRQYQYAVLLAPPLDLGD